MNVERGSGSPAAAPQPACLRSQYGLWNTAKCGCEELTQCLMHNLRAAFCQWRMSSPYLQKPGQQPWRGPFRQALGPESPAYHWIRTWRPAENPCLRPSGWTEGRSGRSERSPYGFQHWTKCRISPSEPVMELKAIKLRAWRHGRVNNECTVFKCLPLPGRCLIWAAWPGHVGWAPGILGSPWQTLQPPSLQEWSTERKIPISPDSNAPVLTQARHWAGRP